MKKVNFLVLAVAIMVSSVLSASTEPAKADNPTTLSKTIGTLLQKPSFEVQEDLTAKVTFTVNEDNEIVVLTVDTDTEAVEDFIKSRLNYEKLDTNKIGEQFTVPVRITAEES